MNDYDKAGRYLIKRDPSGFFRWLLKLTLVAFHAWIDTRRLALPDQGDPTSDLVAALRVGAGYEALCVELQAESASDTARRVIHGYVSRLRSEPGPPEGLELSAIGGVVINFTGPEQPATVQERPTLAPQCRLDGSVFQITLRNEDADAMATEIESGRASRWLLAWLPLMRGGGRPAIVQRWKLEAAKELPERDQQILAWLTLTFAALTDNMEIWQRALEGWSTMKSPVLEALRESERREGREEGRLEESRALLLRLGRKKFRRAASKKQQTELNAITDLTRLEALSERLLDVDSWSELFANP